MYAVPDSINTVLILLIGLVLFPAQNTRAAHLQLTHSQCVIARTLEIRRLQSVAWPSDVFGKLCTALLDGSRFG